MDGERAARDRAVRRVGRRRDRVRLSGARAEDLRRRESRLELHEESVRGPAAVDAKNLDGLICAAHRLDEVPRLIRNALERRASEMRARRSALDPDEQTARVHVPVRRAKTGERGYEV